MAAQAEVEVSFEVYSRHGERWLIEQVFPEQEPAIELAKQLSERPELGGVKVLREIWYPERGQGIDRVVFDSGFALPAPPPPQPAPEPKPRARPIEPEFAPRRRIRPQQKPFPWLAAAGSGLGLIAAVGVLAAML